MKHVSFYLYLVFLITFRNTNLHKHPQFNDLLWFQQSLNKRLLSTYTLAVCSNTLHFVRSFNQISKKGKERDGRFKIRCMLWNRVHGRGWLRSWKVKVHFTVWPMNERGRSRSSVHSCHHPRSSCITRFVYLAISLSDRESHAGTVEFPVAPFNGHCMV